VYVVMDEYAPERRGAEQEVKRLQRCISDLVSVLALPAVWNNSEPGRILETCLDALVKLLDLDFLYAQASVVSHEAPIEVLRTVESNGVGDKRERFSVIYINCWEKLGLMTIRPYEDLWEVWNFRYSHCNWGSRVAWASS
jgi:hypothetical protein